MNKSAPNDIPTPRPIWADLEREGEEGVEVGLLPAIDVDSGETDMVEEERVAVGRLPEEVVLVVIMAVVEGESVEERELCDGACDGPAAPPSVAFDPFSLVPVVLWLVEGNLVVGGEDNIVDIVANRSDASSESNEVYTSTKVLPSTVVVIVLPKYLDVRDAKSLLEIEDISPPSINQPINQSV